MRKSPNFVVELFSEILESATMDTINGLVRYEIYPWALWKLRKKIAEIEKLRKEIEEKKHQREVGASH